MKEVEVRGSYKVKSVWFHNALNILRRNFAFYCTLVVKCSLTGEISFILLNIFLTVISLKAHERRSHLPLLVMKGNH